MKNIFCHLKSFFRSKDMQAFVFPTSLYFHLSAIVREDDLLFKINYKVYDVIDWLNKNFKKNIFDILRRKVFLILKLCQVIEY